MDDFSMNDFVRSSTPIVRTTKLSAVARSYTLRCDAKQAERRFVQFERMMTQIPYFYLGTYLPRPFVKGAQPQYLQTTEGEGVSVINTLSIQKMGINLDDCRMISEEDFKSLDEDKQLKPGDVLLTMDGGTSIGKPAIFDLEADFTVDSHVAILRPEGLAPRVLVYLLASPFGQLQFQQAESGASGQTSVTEEDVRRFRFPKIQLDVLESLVSDLDDVREHIRTQEQILRGQETAAWNQFNLAMLRGAKQD